MDFDAVLDEIGEFGRFQLTNYLLICLPVFFGAANSLSYVFTAGVPNYRCFIPACDNPDNPVYDEPWISYAIPGKTERATVSEHFEPDSCKYYPLHDEQLYNNNTWPRECPIRLFDASRELRCNAWVFDKNEKTIVEEFTITCVDNQWKLSMVGTIHFLGIVAGSAFAGVLADRYGRKLIFIIAIMFMAVTGIGQAYATSYSTFLIFAFLNAIGTSGVYPLAFIIGVEMVGRSKRELSGNLLNCFYAFGEASVGVVMWLSRDWFTLQMLVSAPPLLFILYYWIVPESVRWLLVRQDTESARKIIIKAAKTNGVTLSNAVLASLAEKSDESDNEVIDRHMADAASGGPSSDSMLETIKALLRSKTLVIRCSILLYLWVANAFVYYGLSLNSTNLSGDKYLNFILVCLIEIPGYVITWIIMNKMGRRWSLSASLLLCAFTCAAGGFINEEYTTIIVILFLTGKLGITISFAILFVYSAEVLPTIIRSGGVGTMSMVGRFGAMLAPFVPLLGIYYRALPLILFGIVSLIAGLLAFLLPETLRRKLPDTLDEAERLSLPDEDNMRMKSTDKLKS